MLTKLLKPLASLYITVTLIVLSMVLIYAGTWAQIDHNIHDVQKDYFHSFFTWIRFQTLCPRPAPGQKEIPGGFPMPGGYLVGGMMLLNLLAAHVVRFKITLKALALTLLELVPMVGIFWLWYYQDGWIAAASFIGGVLLLGLLILTLHAMYKKRAGVILIHLGLILLLAGEGVASVLQREGSMPIAEGSYNHYSYSLKHTELAVVQPGDRKDKHTVISDKLLKAGDQIKDPRLPFAIKVDEWLKNSRPAIVREGSPEERKPWVADYDKQFNPIRWTAKPVDTFGGAGSDGEKVDQPSAFVTLTSKEGKPLGSYLLSVHNEEPVEVTVDGRPYELFLRFERDYKPYTIYLHDFTHDVYQGTDVARNYASKVTLVDHERGEKRDSNIHMNHPLRYRGETFFQASFIGETMTVLTVVSNPGAMLPYTAIFVSGVGLLYHFILMLAGFLAKRDFTTGEIGFTLLCVLTVGLLLGIVLIVMWNKSKRDKAEAAKAASAGPKGRGPQSENAKKDRRKYELEPKARFATAQFIVPALVLGVCLVYVLGHAMPPRSSGEYDVAAFGRIPVSFEGRTQPLDTIARNSLKVMRNAESALWVEKKAEGEAPDETTIKPIDWLLDLFVKSDKTRDYKVFRIAHGEVKAFMGLDKARESEKFFSIGQIAPNIDKLMQEAEALSQVPEKGRSEYQNALLDLSRKVNLYLRMANLPSLFAVPPFDTGSKDWMTLGQASQLVQDPRVDKPHPSLDAFMTMVDAARNNRPEEFNRAVDGYLKILDRKIPSVTTKAQFEQWFNRFNPFVLSMVFYIGVLVFTCLSWLGWRKPLAKTAFTLLCLSLVVHTIGLVCRVYISGRPPVTNLYSSAVFVGWGAAIFAALVEVIYKNGIGALAASIIGFVTLTIAHHLSFEGDTMKVLVAVLDTNIWLATHVVIISMGYAATFLAGLLGLTYVVLGVFTDKLDADWKKTLPRMIYGVVCFALVNSFVGTILGGIWADQSWGRFWGWDPKENGAVLIVLGNALVLHARWSGMVRERGIANLAICGNIVTAWSWFGTNMLGVGLHSYGFMQSALWWLLAFVASQLVMIGIGLIPLPYWKSFQEDARPAQQVLPPKK
jgi:ABC-type transport system involved in cytochrome c biogenesis permease subunit